MVLNSILNQQKSTRSVLEFYTYYSVAAQARAIDRIFEILIVGAKPRHNGQAAGANQ